MVHFFECLFISGAFFLKCKEQVDLFDLVYGAHTVDRSDWNIIKTENLCEILDILWFFFRSVFGISVQQVNKYLRISNWFIDFQTSINFEVIAENQNEIVNFHTELSDQRRNQEIKMKTTFCLFICKYLW